MIEAPRDLLTVQFHRLLSPLDLTFARFNVQLYRKSYGLRTQNAYETTLYHNLGALPEQEFTHKLF